MAQDLPISNIAADPSPPSPPLLDLHPCGICGRTFIQKALAKHEQICQKQATKKRKPFNSLAQRVAGTELADFHMKTYLKKTGHQNITPKRSTSTIRSAVAPQGEKCPSCDRNFGAKAFDRHVEWCKEHNLNKPQPSRANLQMAKERLAARTNYRAPQLNSKNQRQINKEKYSSLKTDKSSSNRNSSGEEDILSPARLGRSPSIRRQGSIRKQSETEIVRKVSQKKEKSKTPEPAAAITDPFKLAEQQMQQLILETSTPKLLTNRPKTAPCLKTCELPLIIPTKPNLEETPIRTIYTRNHLVPGIESPKTPHFPVLNKNIKNRISVIDPPMTFQDHFDIDPDLINSTDNLSIPDDLKSDLEGSVDLKDFLFSPLKLPSKPKQMKNREDVEKFFDKVDGNNKNEDDDGEELFNVDDELYAEYKQFEKMYLQEKRLIAGRDSGGGDKKEENVDNSVKAHGDSAYSSLNRSISKEYNIRSSPHNGGDSKSPHTSSSESDTPTKHRKKSSAIHKSLLNSVANPQFDRNDNSSPEDTPLYNNYRKKSFDSTKSNSRPDSIDNERRRQPVDNEDVPNNNRKLSDASRLPKFCHECGAKYPVDIAKFCVECGAKRLVLGF